MTIGERIAKLGFKRWYERTLIESHAYLISAILGLTLAFAGVELVGQHRGGSALLFGVLALILGCVTLVFGLLRYLQTLMRAVNLGERATCRSCSAYAAFDVLASGPPHTTEHVHDADLWLRVKCRKCGNQWRI